MKLKCGGMNREEGFTNIDKYKNKHTDIIIDLDKLPTKFKKNSIEVIKCHCVLEMTKNPADVLLEFHRILKKDGILDLKHVFFNHPRSHMDINCKHYFNFNTIENFIDYYNHNDKLKIIKKTIHYSRFAPLKIPQIGYFIPNYITFISYIIKKIK